MHSDRDLIDTLESALLREHMEAVVATVSGGLAHHFNNVLSGVLGLVSLAPSLDPTALANLGDRLKTQIDHASRLIRVVLTLTRRADSEDALGQSEAVAQARNVVALAAVTARATVRVEADLPDAEVLLPMSPVALDRILLTLLTAALERVAGDDGEVRLAVALTDAGCEVVISSTGATGATPGTVAEIVASGDRSALSRVMAARMIAAAEGSVTYGDDGRGARWHVILPALRPA